MYVRISDLTIGQGDTDGFFARVATDVLPTYRTADGFIAYYGIKQDASNATTVRVFEDEASLDAAIQAASAATDQITQDFSVTNTPHGGDDAAVALAYAPRQTP